ncbi:MAG TPA: tRNA (cytosine(32)/uridine(32)-2'-O)-methyltransferase TrmJ [Moraxellaceae bacterium]|jgi:tRNA (cytidine32/uridine32-2'-O)-methyltransferase|nr:tRNA (cytosine(32)/uridine(32)-2'-O)-methyltransferase TrmJ [Moraxellaceae bacterium]HQX89157.1 tRNA (cytosine(32)/uridine(32)-2'-O)-methyltransferase TrmJ [Moraxellaceae bacterium]
MLSNIRIVLVNTTLPANIGSAARAMKTMGLSDLCLVEPKVFPSPEATALASGADGLLATARVVGTLEEAVADCTLVIGASARSRTIPWPIMDARQAGEAARLESAASKVAIVFGREDRGLTNDELQRCNYHVCIPTDEEYGVLNVASAVQVIAYEVRMAHLMAADKEAGKELQEEDTRMPLEFIRWDKPLVPHDEMEQFYTHFERALVDAGFLAEDNPRQLMARARRIFARIRLDRIEYNMWRGIFTRVQDIAAELKKAKS